MKKYYFDTSIWLDFFENRDEPNLPKGTWAHELLDKIIKTDSKIVYSDHALLELGLIGYPPHEIEELLKPLKPLLMHKNVAGFETPPFRATFLAS